MNKKNIGFILLIFLWLYPAMITSGYDITTLICNLSFIAGIVALFSLKNHTVKNTVIIITSIIGAIADYEYVIVAVPAILLISSYKIIVDNKEENKALQKRSELTLTLSSIFIILQPVYIMVGLGGQVSDFVPSSGSIKEILTIISAFVIVFLLSGIKSKHKEIRISKKRVSQLRSIYLMSLVLASFTGYIYLLKEGFHFSPLQRGTMLYWFVMILSFIYNKDPFIFAVINSHKTENCSKDKK